MSSPPRAPREVGRPGERPPSAPHPRWAWAERKLRPRSRGRRGRSSLRSLTAPERGAQRSRPSPGPLSRPPYRRSAGSSAARLRVPGPAGLLEQAQVPRESLKLLVPIAAELGERRPCRPRHPPQLLPARALGHARRSTTLACPQGVGRRVSDGVRDPRGSERGPSCPRGRRRAGSGGRGRTSAIGPIPTTGSGTARGTASRTCVLSRSPGAGRVSGLRT